MDTLKAQIEDEEVEELPESAEYLEEKDGEEEVQRSYRNGTKHEHSSTSGELRAQTGLGESQTKKSSTQFCSAHPPAVEPAASNHHCPTYQSTSPLPSSTLPHLRHFTAEELAATPGIEAETLPDMGFIESLPESQSGCTSLRSSPRSPGKSDTGETWGLQAAAVFPRTNSGVSNSLLKSDKHHQKPTPLPRKMRQQSPGATYSKTGRSSSLRADCSKSSPDREHKTPKAWTNAALLNESR